MRKFIVVILIGAGLVLLLGLGAWQWQRGVNKNIINLSLADNDYISIGSVQDWATMNYKRVELQGRWERARTFLLANKTHKGKLGFEVFSVFRLAYDNAAVLVNRGWVADKDSWHGELPATFAKGILYIPRKGFVLGDAYRGAKNANPLEIQYFDAPALSRALGEAVQSAVVVLDKDHPAAFIRNWQSVAVSPARHFAYAVQWWGLAITLMVFAFIWRARK